MSFLLEPGELSATPLAAVLLEALNQRLDGVLCVEHGGGTSRLWFRAGRPVGAQVFAGFRPLGHILLQAGLIDMDALSRSLTEMARTGRPQGELLVDLGAVSRAQVDEALADQQAGYFALIAALDAGAFRFDPSQPVPAWTEGSRLSPLRTIVDALERPQARSLVTSALQPVALGGARLASGYSEVAAAFRWSEPERAQVERLLRPASLEVFFAPLPGLPPERARAILSGLLLLGLAVPAAEGPAPTGDTASGLTLDGLPPARSAAAPAPGAAPPMEAGVGARADGRIEGSPAAPPPPPGRRSDPAEARARRQRLLARAMQNMGVGPFGARPVQAAAPSAAPGAAAGAPGAPGAPRVVPGSAEAALRQALLDMAPRARERNLFTRLGLAQGAGKEEVKRAFLQLARQFHPDRFSAPELGDLRQAVSDLFSAVNEAYEVLSDDRKRAEYLAALKGGAGNPQQAEAGRVDFQKGEACLRTRDFGRARGFLESALRADARPEYQAALAWTYVVDPAARDLARARTLAAGAAKDEACDRAHYVLGIVARDEGSDAEAERCFRAALAANPRHVDAQRELRLLEGRRSQRRG